MLYFNSTNGYIIIKNICIFVIGNGSGRFAATDEKGIR